MPISFLHIFLFSLKKNHNSISTAFTAVGFLYGFSAWRGANSCKVFKFEEASDEVYI